MDHVSTLTLAQLKPYPKSRHSYALGASVALELFRHRPEAARGLVLSPQGTDNAGAGELAECAARLALPVLTSGKAIERLSPKGNCYAVGVFEPLPEAPDPRKNHVVLVDPGDAGNLGTILRTALAFGILDIAVVRGADPFDPRVVRASMGAIFRMRVSRFDDFDAYRAGAGERGYYPFMLGARVELQDARAMAPYSLILGNEASGLPGEFLGVGTPVRIPHGDAVDSLNLAAAAAIGLWHFAGPRG